MLGDVFRDVFARRLLGALGEAFLGMNGLHEPQDSGTYHEAKFYLRRVHPNKPKAGQEVLSMGVLPLHHCFVVCWFPIQTGQKREVPFTRQLSEGDVL